MKTRLRIIAVTELPPGEAAKILTPAGIGPDMVEVDELWSNGRDPELIFADVKVDLDAGDERIAKVFALIEKLGLESKSSTYNVYSEEDIQNARLLLMTPAGDVEVDAVCAGLPYGTRYDLRNACSNCGTGAKQASELYVAYSDMTHIRRHCAVGTRSDDILVDERMRKKLVDAGITGISFGEVRARHKNRKWRVVARDQILIEHTMPPIRAEFPAADDYALCKVCRRGGRLTIPDHAYREEDLVGMQDFNLFWEWFGEFRTAGELFGAKRSHRYVLVTPKAMNIFREARVTTFKWTPVGIEE